MYGYDYEYEEYYEPTIADEIFEEAKQKLESALKESAQKLVDKVFLENEELKKENEELKCQVDEIENRERDLDRKIESYKREVLGMRLKELFADRHIVMYQPDYIYVDGRKCDECDENRKIVFNSPQGNIIKEACKCSKQYKIYSPKEMHCTEMRWNRNNGNDLTMWYKQYDDSGDGYSSSNAFYGKDVWNGQPYEEIENYYKYIFKSREECDAYCQYRNEKEY